VLTVAVFTDTNETTHRNLSVTGNCRTRDSTQACQVERRAGGATVKPTNSKSAPCSRSVNFVHAGGTTKSNATTLISNARSEKYAVSRQITAGTVNHAEEYAQKFGAETLTRG
jgi:hypothetical protein